VKTGHYVRDCECICMTGGVRYLAMLLNSLLLRWSSEKTMGGIKRGFGFDADNGSRYDWAR